MTRHEPVCHGRCPLSVLGLLLTMMVASGDSVGAPGQQVIPVAAKSPATIIFTESVQSLGDTRTFGVAIADVDLDDDNDIFISNYIGANRLWLNDGSGTFTPSSQSFGPIYPAHDVDMADLNGDLFPDIFVVYHDAPSRIYLNDGAGGFVGSGQEIGSAGDHPQTIQLCDVDDDTDVDALIYSFDAPNRIWLNDGNGLFAMSGPDHGGSDANGMILANLNADAFPDLYISLRTQPNQVWLNDGSGNFTNSGQSLGDEAEDFACADVDADGDTDIVVVRFGEISILLNQNNTGTFVAGFSYGEGALDCSLLDADSDGDQDLVTAHIANGNGLWLNDGAGCFAPLGSIFGTTRVLSVACGQLDADGDDDVLFGKLEGNGGNAIYFNESTSVGIRDPVGLAPPSFRLYQSFPNPLNPEATIAFELKESSRTSLKIYDVAGREIETLVDEVRASGRHQVGWSADDVPSGVYFVRLLVGHPAASPGRLSSATQKLILQR